MQTLLLVSHTHWDREWYLTFEEYRTRLVGVFDQVLDVLETVPAFHSFTFDGQTVPVDDYTEIRPEAMDRIRAQVRAGRLSVGPLYVIPDGYAPTGEAWVRIFLLGLERCADLGGNPGYVYIAEPTNQPEQMPQIVRRFGFDAAIFGRGLQIDQRDGSNPRVDDGEYFWESADGSRVLVVHMPAAYDDDTGSRCILHYCNAAEIFWGQEYDPLREQERSVTAETPEGALERIRILREYLSPLATSDTLLLMHGCDHLPPQADTPALIAAVNDGLDGARVVHGDLADYLERVRTCGNVHVVRRGESRGRGGAMSRVWLRRLISDAQVLLERWMEPSVARAWQAGDAQDRRGLVRQAWRYLLQNYAHDTIWGCSVDSVYDEVAVRFAKCTQIAGELVGETLLLLSDGVNTAALPDAPDSVPYVAWSASGWGNSDVVEAELWLSPNMHAKHLFVADHTGARWAAQVLEARQAVRRTDRFVRTAMVEPVTGVQALLRTGSIPAMGHQAVVIAPAPSSPETDLRVGATWIENDSLRVELCPDGSFDLTDKTTGRTIRGLNRIEDEGDRGNGWRYSRVEEDRVVSASEFAGRLRVVETGPVRATIEARVPLKLPEGLTRDKKRRLKTARLCPLTVRVSLLTGLRRVEVRTELDNRVRNHRLRGYFPTGIVTDSTVADGAFAVHDRPIYLTDQRPRAQPQGIGLHPSTPEEDGMMHSFVDASDGSRGLALLTKGVPQYEVLRDERDTAAFALTLMRAAVGHTRIHDPDLTHGGQCIGVQRAEYAVFPHNGDWLEGEVHREAERYLAPPRLVRTRRHDGDVPPCGAWIADLPPEVALTTVKRSQDGAALVVRLVNLLRTAVTAVVRFADKPDSVWRANLREEPEERAAVLPDGAVRVHFLPMEIVTLRLEWAERRR